MLRVTNIFENEYEKRTELEFYCQEFYGPLVKLIVHKKNTGIPYVEVDSNSYNYEDASVAEGINNTMIKAAKELLEKYGEFRLRTKFGIVYIDSEKVEEIFEELLKSIELF